MFEKHMERLGTTIRLEQKTALLGMAGVLRNVLFPWGIRRGLP